MELIEEVMDTAERIKTSIPVCERKQSFAVDSFIWLSPTNVEEGWYHNPLIKDLTDKAKEETSDRGQRKIEREKNN